jgi:hypothetical protein
MARFNEINVGHYNRFLQKASGIKGGPPVPQLSSELQPTLQVFSGSENRYLAAWNVFMRTTTVPAAAALNSGGQLRNPNNSNVLAVITQLAIRSGAAGNTASITMGTNHGGDLGTVVGNVQPMDARWRSAGPVSGQATCIVSSQNSPSVGDLNFQLRLASLAVANQDYDMIILDDLEIPLLPNDAVRVVITPSNNTLGLHFSWRERFLEESERI